MTEKEMFDLGMERVPYNLVNRVNDDIYIYKSPDGYHFESDDGLNYGTMIYGGKKLTIRCKLVKDKK